MEIYARYIHNDMIKPSDDGQLESIVDSVKNKFLIIDTTLRSCILPQVYKMNPRLHHICGCDICMIPKYINIYLNRFRTNIVTYLQDKYVGIQTYNSSYSTKSDSYYKQKVFPDGECLHATIKDVSQCISCTPINPNNSIQMNCDLGFCDKFPKYIIPDKQFYYGPDSLLILFSVYTYQVRREKVV